MVYFVNQERKKKQRKKKKNSETHDKSDYYILCGYQCDKAVTKNDTREVI